LFRSVNYFYVKLGTDALIFAACLVAANAVITAFPIALFVRRKSVFNDLRSAFAQLLGAKTLIQICSRHYVFHADEMPELVLYGTVMDYTIFVISVPV
jgi:hypothetical protein